MDLKNKRDIGSLDFVQKIINGCYVEGLPTTFSVDELSQIMKLVKSCGVVFSYNNKKELIAPVVLHHTLYMRLLMVLFHSDLYSFQLNKDRTFLPVRELNLMFNTMLPVFSNISINNVLKHRGDICYDFENHIFLSLLVKKYFDPFSKLVDLVPGRGCMYYSWADITNIPYQCQMTFVCQLFLSAVVAGTIIDCDVQFRLGDRSNVSLHNVDILPIYHQPMILKNYHGDYYSYHSSMYDTEFITDGDIHSEVICELMADFFDLDFARMSDAAHLKPGMTTRDIDNAFNKIVHLIELYARLPTRGSDFKLLYEIPHKERFIHIIDHYPDLASLMQTGFATDVHLMSATWEILPYKSPRDDMVVVVRGAEKKNLSIVVPFVKLSYDDKKVDLVIIQKDLAEDYIHMDKIVASSYHPYVYESFF